MEFYLHPSVRETLLWCQKRFVRAWSAHFQDRTCQHTAAGTWFHLHCPRLHLWNKWKRCSWSGLDVFLIWSKSGLDLVLIWSWCGPDLVQNWFWCGPDLVLVWSWCDSDLVLINFWSGPDLILTWSWSGSYLVLIWSRIFEAYISVFLSLCNLKSSLTPKAQNPKMMTMKSMTSVRNMSA